MAVIAAAAFTAAAAAGAPCNVHLHLPPRKRTLMAMTAPSLEPSFTNAPEAIAGDPGPWLDSLGFSEHTPAFRQQAVTLDLVATLTDADLITLGVESLGQRKRLLAAAVGLRSMEHPPVDPVFAALAATRALTRPTSLEPSLLPPTAVAIVVPALVAGAVVFAGYLPLALLPAPLQDDTGLIEPLQWAGDALVVTAATLAVFALVQRSGLTGILRFLTLAAGIAGAVATASAFLLERSIIGFNLMLYVPLLVLLAALAAHGKPVRPLLAGLLALLPFGLWLFGEFGLHRIVWEAKETAKIHGHIAASILASLTETLTILVAVAVGLQRLVRARRQAGLFRE